MAGATEPNLTCPYTGAPMEVEVVPATLGKDGPVFRLKGGFDPGATYGSREELDDKLRHRNGRRGNVKTLRCPYLGTEIAIIKVGDFFTARGGWSPRSLYSTEQELLYAASTRKGEPPQFEQRTRVGAVEHREQQSDPAHDLRGTSEEVEIGLEMIMED